MISNKGLLKKREPRSVKGIYRNGVNVTKVLQLFGGSNPSLLHKQGRDCPTRVQVE